MAEAEPRNDSNPDPITASEPRPDLDDSVLVAQLREALRTRAPIEQAKGILMANRRCSADEAFATLRRMSNETNRKLHDVAADVINDTTHRTPTTHDALHHTD